MKVLISDHLDERCAAILRAEQCEVDDRPGLGHAELLNVIGSYDALIVRSATTVDAGVIERGTRLKMIGRAGTGVDNIDVEAATRRGILVMNTPGGNTISAAEHTVSMMLALARNIPQAHMSLARGEWDRKRFVGTEVFEKTLGVVGLGKIGREVASRCRALGMTVLGFDPVLGPEAVSKLGIESVSVDELVRRSDFITVHTPLTEETRGLLGEEAFAQCKRGVRIINCARGGIVDEAALLRALESGQVHGAALDVFEHEPPKNNPLLAHPHVVATPHLGASTEEAQGKVALQIAHQLADALHGRAYTGVVNGAVMQMTLNEELRPLVRLAECMGSMSVQLSSGPLRRISVIAEGDPAAGSLELLKAGVLKGILSHVVPEPVNFISAPHLAAELGLVVAEGREPPPGQGGSQVKLRFETDAESHTIKGAVFGASLIRLVGLDGFRFEVNPDGYCLIYNNLDKPGILAQVSAILAHHSVNIAGLSLGRTSAGGEALTLMSLDGPLSKECLAELSRLADVRRIRLVRFDV